MRKFLITLFLVLGLSSLSWAADRHVGSGQTYTTIQAGVNAAVAGDTIYIHAGTYNEQVEIDNKVGTSGSPITLTPYSTDTVTINGGGGDDYDIWIHGTSAYIIIDGKNQLTINGGASKYPIRCAPSSGSITGIQIKNCVIDVDYSSGSGIIVTATDDMLVSEVSFTGSMYRGIEGSNAGTAPSVGAWRMKITGCTFPNPGYAGVEASGTSYWYIYKNYFYASTSGLQHLIVHRGGTNWKIENNVFEVRTGGALYAIAVLRDDSSYSGYNISNETYMNNTFATTGGTVSNGYGVVFLAWPDGTPVHSGVRIQNNLFIGNFGTTNGIFQWGSGTVSTSNCYINNNHKTATDGNSAWGTPTGYTMTNNTNGAVSYVAAGNKPSPYFDLSASYDGSSLNSPPTDDYDGNARAATPDIGAFEYGVGSPASVQGLTIQGGTLK